MAHPHLLLPCKEFVAPELKNNTLSGEYYFNLNKFDVLYIYLQRHIYQSSYHTKTMMLNSALNI